MYVHLASEVHVGIYRKQKQNVISYHSALIPEVSREDNEPAAIVPLMVAHTRLAFGST